MLLKNGSFPEINKDGAGLQNKAEAVAQGRKFKDEIVLHGENA